MSSGGGARRAALEALLDITEGGAYANLRLGELKGKLQERDVRWAYAAVYATLEHLLYIDHIIGAYAKGRIAPRIRGVLRLGVAQLLYMDVPPRSAVSESVKLTKEIGKGALSGYVNGVMRSICRGIDDPPPLPQDTLGRLSVQYSYPEYLVEEYLGCYGDRFTEDMLACAQDTSVTIRAQYPYTSEQLADELRERGIAFRRGALDEQAFILGQGLDVSTEPLFGSGRITVQGESAMLVCRLADPGPGVRILDCCAAPGGKSAYMMSLSKNRADVTAWELHPHRVELMKNTFARLNVPATVSLRDASVHDDSFDGRFDTVLIDAPCSGLGVPGKSDARYSKSSGIIDAIAATQARILDSCAGYVRSGGSLIYATCTISRRENEAQIGEFLRRHPEFEPADISGALPPHLEERIQMGCMIQLFPHIDKAEGFFLSKLKRRQHERACIDDDPRA